jgi:Fe-S cluster biosynthesis and repair protein YggX
LIFVYKKTLENHLALLKLFLPDILVEHFDLISSNEIGETLHLYFEEQNKPPVEHASKLLVSKGFHDEITVQDFPLRGKKVFLHIKRRRWTEKQTNLIVQRDWNLVSKGSRITEEFAAFLKEISRF